MPGAPHPSSPSPPTDRAVSVVELLARTASPLSARSVSVQLDLNRATCAAILTTLVQRGWVAVDEAGYRTGPALVAMSADLRSRVELVRLGEPVLRALADELDVGVTLSQLDGTWLTTLVLVEPPGGTSARRPPLPTRLALHPPMGAAIVAFLPPADVDAWLAQAHDPKARAHLRRFLAAVRHHGLGVFRYDEVATAIGHRLATIRRTGLHPRPGQVVQDEIGALLLELSRHGFTRAELERATSAVPVAMVAAPLFDRRGTPSHELALHVARSETSVADLRRQADRLLATCDELTVLCGGTVRPRPAGRWPRA